MDRNLRVTDKLRKAVLCSEMKAYQIAHKAGIHPSMLSKLMCGIDFPQPEDKRIQKVGKVLGLEMKDCLEYVPTGP